MWIADLKIVLGFCICTALAYQGAKQDYIKWKERKPTTTTTESALVTSENDIYYENLKLRHHSRFPNLDRVMLKIDNMKTEKNKGLVHKVRHQNVYRTTTTTTDEGLFGDDYKDYEEDTDYDDWNENADSFDDYEEDSGDDDPFADEENEWQAEEATEPQILAPVSSMTKFKWDNYGTRPRVEESRRQQLHLKPINEVRATNAVIEHYMKVRQQGQCRTPQPKVIPVQSVHPNPGKTYTPHCTILHRCAEDTGCCSNSDMKCGPKTQTQVHLLFYTKTLGVLETRVEKLTFLNHTECACIEKSSSVPYTSPQEVSLKTGTQPENMKLCKCPEEFTPKFRYDARCSCDCDDDNQDCIRMKKGKEFFSLTDRRCIIEGECGTPACEYGVYMRHIGRCQRKQEKLDSFSRTTV